VIATLAIASYVRAITINEISSVSSQQTVSLKDVLPCVGSKTELYKLALSSLSRKYGVNYNLLDSIITCESSWNDEAEGDCETDKCKAYGLLQFHKPTFDRFCEGNYKDGFAQLECGVKMFSEGLSGHWSCMKLI
jgi:soluble lytic murein transglycosylase-like protein